MDDATKAYLAAKAGDVTAMATEQLMKMKKVVEDGESTWKYLGFLAGCMIMAVSALGALSALFGLGIISLLLYVYVFCAGAILACLEFKDALIPVKYKEMIRREALFLYRPYGRAAFYMGVGLIMINMGGFLTLLVGLYTTAVGAYIYYGSTQALKSLNDMKKDQAPTDLKAMFDRADKNHDGVLDTSELAVVCAELGTTLSKNELESALFMLDKNGDGKISFEEFQAWWGVNDSLA